MFSLIVSVVSLALLELLPILHQLLEHFQLPCSACLDCAHIIYILCRAPIAGALSDDARLTSDVCLLRTSGLSREQRGLG